jgi:hypothetical protein
MSRPSPPHRTVVGLDPLPRPFQVFSRKGPLQRPFSCVVGCISRAIDLVADGASHGFTVRSLHPPRVWQASEFRSFASTWPVTRSLVRPFVKKKTNMASADLSLRLTPSPFQAQAEISPGKDAILHHTTAGFTLPPVDHKCFAVTCPLALIGIALYPNLVHRLMASIHTSPPYEVALIQLRFTSFAVASLRRDFHPQDCAHAGRRLGSEGQNRPSLLAFKLSA